MPGAATAYHHPNQPVSYKDLYLRLITCTVATHIIIVYGETKSTFEILLTPAYYYAFIGSFLIALILFSAVRAITIRLDKNFDWMEKPASRIGLQFFFGLVLPGLMAFLLAALYFRVRGYNILNTSYLRYDFQFILLQILLINGYYICYYFYSRWKQASAIIGKIGITGPTIAERQTFIVSKGAASIMLDFDQIAYCYRDGESNFLRTTDAEDFFISQTLDQMEQLLPKDRFFRANRQCILHHKACLGYGLMSYGKLEANIEPPFQGEVIISQKKALAFKKWLEEKKSFVASRA